MADRRIQNWPLGSLVGSTILAGALIVSQQSLASDTEFFAEPTWQPVDAQTVYQQLDDYLRSGASTTERQQAARAEWWDAAAIPGATSASSVTGYQAPGLSGLTPPRTSRAPDATLRST